MGATVLVSSEQLLAVPRPSNFSPMIAGVSRSLPFPRDSIRSKSRWRDFCRPWSQHIQIDDQHATLLQIVLGSVFSSFEQLRRPAGQPVASDDWSWVLRTSAASRAVLRWQDSPSPLDPAAAQADGARTPSTHGRLALTSGADRPGAVSARAASPTTSFAYDLGVGPRDSFSWPESSATKTRRLPAAFAAAWLPSGQPGAGPVTTLLIRKSRLDPAGPAFRGLRISRDDQLVLGDRVTIRYGAEYLVADSAAPPRRSARTAK